MGFGWISISNLGSDQDEDGAFTVFSNFSRLFDDGFEIVSVSNIFDIGQCICCFVYPVTHQYNFFTNCIQHSIFIVY